MFVRRPTKWASALKSGSILSGSGLRVPGVVLYINGYCVPVSLLMEQQGQKFITMVTVCVSIVVVYVLYASEVWTI